MLLGHVVLLVSETLMVVLPTSSTCPTPLLYLSHPPPLPVPSPLFYLPHPLLYLPSLLQVLMSALLGWRMLGRSWQTH